LAEATEIAAKPEKQEKAEKPEPKTRPASKKAAAAAQTDVWGTGRRKSSVARVRVRKGDGKFVVNRKPHGEYFFLLQDRNTIEEALTLVGARQKIDVVVTVKGGGPTGQAGAVSMGLARALRKLDSAYDEPLRLSGLLTRDSRMKERKKYGRRGARRGFQFSKR
jgi:small subunit ribosomal protein S9